MDALARYYAQRAPEYERIYQKPERQADLRALREFVAQTFTGRLVLEIACGTGWWTEVLSSTARSVLATDINDEVLAIARTKPFGDATISFQRCDAFQIDQVAGSFDAALAVFWWSHLTSPDLEKFLQALHRRLKPGGVVVFIDNQFVPGSSTPISRRDEEGNTYQQRRLDDDSATEVLKNFPTDEEITRVLQCRAHELTISRSQYFWTARYMLGK
jgi:ubiquinone/menaquinone biosynthesis C-methylase UbiE